MTTNPTAQTQLGWKRIARDIIVVQGNDAEKYLHSQLSQAVEGMPVGESRQSLLLQPTGKLDAVLRVTRFADTVFVLDTEQGCAEAVMARLNRFKIRVQATVEQMPWQCVALRGAGARAAAESLNLAPSDGRIVPAWWGTDEAVDLIGATVADVALDAVVEFTDAEFNALRIQSGWPEVGIDIEPGCVPGETGLLGVAVSFSKGCYPGQELVERMDSRAAVAPKQLRRITVSEGSQVGDEVVVGGVSAGVITSVAGTFAIARLGRDAHDYGEALQPS